MSRGIAIYRRVIMLWGPCVCVSLCGVSGAFAVYISFIHSGVIVQLASAQPQACYESWCHTGCPYWYRLD